MNNRLNEDQDADLRSDEEWSEIDVGTRIDLHGKTTYHALTSDRRVGYFVEKVYNDKHNLVRIIKRGKQSRSETDFDPETGDAIRMFESSRLADGNSMTKEIVYRDDRSRETVAVVSGDGDLIRTVQREFAGIRTIFQGQTDYKSCGIPQTTINHKMDPDTGRLISREQIRWLKDGQRALTETYQFNARGAVSVYTKVLYHATGSPFIEEIHRYGESGHMLRREIMQLSPDGIQTSADITMYDEGGEIIERSTTYYDHREHAGSRGEEEEDPLAEYDLEQFRRSEKRRLDIFDK